ncbi:hypothetical protein [Lapidilactobacillus gannanensis]|jgi:hypothetical protein|uniref:Uncharacterized protein n=1 Tax=Lapidilactobacillus gannanensis TaxID=2486002 RepID=A0ABW4BIK8_9LACO|nr:hypothetical protein [Lapidilactobacillus gannanensis]MCH4056491.1 hypothetical protein [Lactobacillaceae bacterium]
MSKGKIGFGSLGLLFLAIFLALEIIWIQGQNLATIIFKNASGLALIFLFVALFFAAVFPDDRFASFTRKAVGITIIVAIIWALIPVIMVKLHE